MKVVSLTLHQIKKIYIIGDSHMASLMFDLKDRIVKSNYQFITSTFEGCLFYPGFNLVIDKTNKVKANCSNNYFERLKEILSKDKNSIIILGGRFPLHISNYFFDEGLSLCHNCMQLLLKITFVCFLIKTVYYN